MRAPIHQRIPVSAGAAPVTARRDSVAQCGVTATASLLSAKLRDAGHELIPAPAPALPPVPAELPAAIRVIAGLPRRHAPRLGGLLIHDRDDVAVLSLRGEPDVAGASLLQAQLSQLRWQARARSVVDLTHLAFLDCACLGVLVRHRRLICGQGGSFALAGPQPAVLAILAVTGLRTWFEVYDTVEQAVAVPGPRQSPVLLAALARTSSRP
jgi:anti-anti-sigma factor